MWGVYSLGLVTSRLGNGLAYEFAYRISIFWIPPVNFAMKDARFGFYRDSLLRMVYMVLGFLFQKSIL